MHAFLLLTVNLCNNSLYPDEQKFSRIAAASCRLCLGSCPTVKSSDTRSLFAAASCLCSRKQTHVELQPTDTVVINWETARSAAAGRQEGRDRVDFVFMIKGSGLGGGTIETPHPLNSIRRRLVRVSQRCASLRFSFNWWWIIYNRGSHVPAQVTGAAHVPSTYKRDLKESQSRGIKTEP